MIQTNIPDLTASPASPWRKVSLGSWRPTGDSSIHTMLELDIEPFLHLQQSKDVSLNAFIAKVMAEALRKVPQINSVIRFGRIYRRPHVDVFFHVVNPDLKADDLSGIVLRRADQKSATQLESEFKQTVQQERSSPQASRFYRTKLLFKRCPGWLARFLLDLNALLSYTLNINIPALGIPADAFGSLMITNIGSLGIDNGFVPIAPYTRIPMVLAVGKVDRRPVVEGDAVVARQTVKLCFTFDHRLMDGLHFAKMATVIRESFAHPERILSPEPQIKTADVEDWAGKTVIKKHTGDTRSTRLVAKGGQHGR